MARVLVACEFSGRVAGAFRSKGHDAWSCDIVAALQGWDYHLRQDVTELLEQPWDLVVAHPPCTFLAHSGIQWFRKRFQERMEGLIGGVAFFKKCLGANSPRVCVENPVPHKRAADLLPDKYTQIIHPWWFGDPEPKPTCLWLKGLPNLVPTALVPRRKQAIPKNHRRHVLGLGRMRSIFSQAIA